MELIFTDEDQVVPKPGTLLQRGTGKRKSAGLAVIDTSVQSHSLRELSWLGMAIPAPGSQFSENWDWGKSFPQELPRNARPGGIDLYPICQQGRGQGDGSQG